MKWFRLYNEITRDRKLRRHPAYVRWTWIAVLAIASESPNRGYLLLSEDIPATIEDIADEAAISVEEAHEAMGIFTKQKQIEKSGNAWKVVRWEERQYDNDSSKERVKRYRNKKKTLLKQDCNVTETLQKSYGNEIETTCNGYSNVSVTPPDTEYREENSNSLPETAPPEPPTSDVENVAAQLVLAFHTTFSEHRKIYSTGGAIKAHDEFVQRLKDGWTKDEILYRMSLDWSNGNGPPSPWTIFGKHPDDDRPYGPGKRFKTEEEFNAWGLTMVRGEECTKYQA